MSQLRRIRDAQTVLDLRAAARGTGVSSTLHARPAVGDKLLSESSSLSQNLIYCYAGITLMEKPR